VIIRYQETDWPSDWMDEIEHRLSGEGSEVLPPTIRDEDHLTSFWTSRRCIRPR